MEDRWLQRARRGFFLAWIPASAGLWVALSLAGGRGFLQSAPWVLGLCLLYAWLCYSARYLCRVLPLRRERLSRWLLTHILAALLVSALWTAVAWLLDEGWNTPARDWLGVGLVWFGSGVLLYLVSVGFHYLLLSLEETRLAEQAAHRSALLQRDAEVRALRAQLNPHFLFNSLTALASLLEEDPARARDMCILLAEFLRSALQHGGRAAVSLEEEMALAHQYLAIEKIRFGERLAVEEDIPAECRAARLPPLLLQPLVENAIKHGVSQLLEGGFVKLAARREQGGLSLSVENRFDPEAAPSRPAGMGLRLTEQRLRAFAGDEAWLRVTARGDRFTSSLWLPDTEGA
ncbi:MAG: histidine kinase [Myxococcales bacterium]|nr:histidine kinase [Myxococcales bacterium]